MRRTEGSKFKHLWHSLIMCVLLGVMPSFAVEQAPVSSQVKSGTFFVAPNGSDSWSGRIPRANADRTDGPFATLHAACSASRKPGTKRPRKVIVQAGQYFFDKPLVLNVQDAGLTIEATLGARVCLYGGRKVAGWKKDGKKFY